MAHDTSPQGSQDDVQTPLGAASSDVEKPRQETGDGTDRALAEVGETAGEAETELGRLQKVVAAQDQTIGSLEEQILRLRADYENASRRHANMMEAEKFRAREGIVKGVLPLVDNLERAAAAAVSTDNVQALVEGIRLIIRQMTELLSREGVTEIDASGLLDPNVHEVVFTEERDDVPDQQILETLQKGYRLGQSVLRASLVKVASNPGKA